MSYPEDFSIKTLGKQVIQVIWLLGRWPAVISWCGSGIAMGFGLAVIRQGWNEIPWDELLAVVIAGFLLQGYVSHGVNDLTDWLSSTDRYSPGILSGGSKTLHKGLVTGQGLIYIASSALGIVLFLGWFLGMRHGLWIVALLLIGCWSALAYTIPPIRLAYRPLAGEWLAGFPAAVTVTIGTFYLVTGNLTSSVVWASVLHGLLAIAWLMQHHLPDIKSDLAATPPKLTTPALIYRVYGPKAVRFVAAAYFFLVVLVALTAAAADSPVFLVSAGTGVLGMVLALATDWQRVGDVTEKEWVMIFLPVVNALLVIYFFARS